MGQNEISKQLALGMIQEKKLPAWIVGKGLSHSEPPVCKTVIPQFPERVIGFLALIVSINLAYQLPAFGPAAFFGLNTKLQCQDAALAGYISAKVHAAV